MRAGVLRDQGVQKVLGEKFVCSWKNIEDEGICGSSYAHEPTEKPGACQPGDGEHNTQLCVWTPDGRLLDVMAGYQTPELLIDELKWAWDTVRPIGLDANASVEDRKARIAKEFEKTVGHNKSNGGMLDDRWMIKHAMDSWGEFKADDLVEGRGFGDHFFGRFAKDMPGEALGKVPGYQQAVVDERRCQEIMEETKKLKAKYALSEGKSREELMARLRELETEYKELKARSAEVAKKLEAMAKK